MHKEIETLPNGDEHTAALKLVLALEVADTALQIVLAAGNVNRECACRSASTRKQMLLSLQAADGYIRGALANAYDLLPRIKNKAVLDAAAQAQVAFDTVTEAISSIPGARYQ